MRIDELDKNFKTEGIPQAVEREAVWRDVRQAPFTVWGLMSDDDGFTRMPREAAAQVSPATQRLARFAAGGQVTFQTDSPYVAVLAELGDTSLFVHFTTLGAAGFDLYVDNAFQAPIFPPYNPQGQMSGYASLPAGLKRLTLNLPLYTEVKSLYIGLAPQATVAAYSPYRATPPIVYYGSSITHGACASRPGLAYEHRIARKNGRPFLNLGFSGNAKGEEAMARYIASLEMSAFVLDYDHNAPNTAHLQNTHERFYRIVRQAHPALPIVMVSAPPFKDYAQWDERRAVIRATFLRAQAAGEPVRFVDGGHFFDGVDPLDLTADRTHPNDWGFYYMANAIGAALDEML